LEDGLAMMPGTKLAGYDQLEVIARISFTGNAISQPGDWFGAAVVGSDEDAVAIGIDTLVE
jgi:cytochrome c-type biogenesis protein CcmH